MNTRLLRASERTVVGRARIFPNMGQMQPVIMGFERGRLTLRIEGVSDGRACWWVLVLPEKKTEAKRLFAELEACHKNGTPSAATTAWKSAKDLNVANQQSA